MLVIPIPENKIKGGMKMNDFGQMPMCRNALKSFRDGFSLLGRIIDSLVEKGFFKRCRVVSWAILY
jgi:hypothetical protein